ncbi:MAG: sensor histidine kinase [Chloroflexota bacterium]
MSPQNNPLPGAAQHEARIRELEQQLSEANATIQALITDKVDAVLASGVTTPLLLQQAQAALHIANEELEQRVAQRTAELERSNRDLEDFAFIISHDLQEPLRKVQAFGGLLNELAYAKLDATEKDYLGRMLNATERMDVMLTDLLAFSRVNTHGGQHIPLALNQVLQQVLQDLELRIQRCGGVVEVADLPQIHGDPTQMGQLFQNLLANALKFHAPGTAPQVRVSSRRPPPADLAPDGDLPGELAAPSTVQILVEDNGIGFDMQYVERIFQPFQRLHGRSEYEGNGIGLAICRKIVERHRGTLTASSVPGQGSVFTITLPVD